MPALIRFAKDRLLLALRNTGAVVLAEEQQVLPGPRAGEPDLCHRTPMPDGVVDEVIEDLLHYLVRTDSPDLQDACEMEEVR